jgi:hypothetical protein
VHAVFKILVPFQRLMMTTNHNRSRRMPITSLQLLRLQQRRTRIPVKMVWKIGRWLAALCVIDKLGVVETIAGRKRERTRRIGNLPVVKALRS